jgi:hypothetical protein
VSALAKAIGIDPKENITTREQDPGCFMNAEIDVRIGHRRQRSAADLARSLVPELQMIQNAVVLRIKENDRSIAIR